MPKKITHTRTDTTVTETMEKTPQEKAWVKRWHNQIAELKAENNALKEKLRRERQRTKK